MTVPGWEPGMGLGTRDIIGRGLYRTFRPNGLLLVAGVVVANVVFQIGISSLTLEMTRSLWDELVETYPDLFESSEDPASLLPLAFDLPDAVAIGLLLVGFLLTVILLGVAVRVFATDNTDSIPRNLLVRDLGWMAVNISVGTLLFLVVWVTGLALFLVPGIILYVLLIYYLPAIAIENRSFVGAMARSWRITRGNRLAVFVLFLAFFALWFGVTLVVLVLNGFVVLVHPLAAELVNQVANAALTVLFAAIVAISFNELVPKRAGDTDGDDDPFEEFIPADRNVQW